MEQQNIIIEQWAILIGQWDIVWNSGQWGILMEGDSYDEIAEQFLQRVKNNNATVCLHERTVWHCNVIRDIVLGYSDMVTGQSGIVLGWWVS